jgi:pimeloyl-ACP methyl ester carboxylesterase
LKLSRPIRRVVLAGLLVATTGAAVVTAASAGATVFPFRPPGLDGVAQLLADQPPTAGNPNVDVPVIKWQQCPDDQRFPDAKDMQCATVPVPLDYNDPRGKKITLSLVRLPAGEPKNRIGTLFTNPGGPGGSGVDFVKGDGKQAFPQSVRARFDLVGFDPRGVAASTPVRCFDSNDQADRFFGDIPPFPLNRSEEQETIRTNQEFARRCEQRNGALLNHVGTADVARDMDLLRAAVGDSRLNYVGFSYGTYLGAIYANLFPQRIRAMALDGVLDEPRFTSGPPGTISTTRINTDLGGEATLKEFFRLCKAGGPRCAFGDGDPAGAYQKIINTLTEHPVEVPTPDGKTETVSVTSLISDLKGVLTDPAGWEDFAKFLQQVRRTIEGLRPDPTLFPPAPKKQARDTLPQQPAYNNESDAFSAVVCADTDNPRDPARWQQVAVDREKVAPNFGPLEAWNSGACAQWAGRSVGRFTGPLNARTANPVLVVNNRFDPSTAVESAVRLNKLLPNSRLLISEGWGHIASGKSTCVDNAVADYVLAGNLPTHNCQPDAVPFTDTKVQPGRMKAATKRTKSPHFG